jgi:hypothetical protein
MKPWMKYDQLFKHCSQILDRSEADQTEPAFSRVFDFMVGLCSVAGPEFTLNEDNGDFTSVGHAVIYERWVDRDVDHEAQVNVITCECDGWILTTLQNDGGYSLVKVGDPSKGMNFSHEEPDWEPRVLELLGRTYWRPLNMESLLLSR